MKGMLVKGAKTDNELLVSWITETAKLCKPERVIICDGSQEEYDRLCNEMVESGTFIRLKEKSVTIASSAGQILKTWLEWKAVPMYALLIKPMQGPRITGFTRQK